MKLINSLSNTKTTRSLAALMGLSLLALVGCSGAPPKESGPSKQAEQSVALNQEVVEVACGECQLGMGGSSCDLAMRCSAGSFFVDGSTLDDHGDAHGEDGMCNCIRKAKVTGKVENGRFAAKSIELLPYEKPAGK